MRVEDVIHHQEGKEEYNRDVSGIINLRRVQAGSNSAAFFS